MRSFLAGLAILFFLSAGAMAQVTGFVESVGIASRIRPDTWNSLRVNLTSTISEPMQYQLQVWQEDLDKDRVIFTREITLSPKTQEKFELYFLPEKNLGASDNQPISVGELQRSLQVRVCLPPGEGKKPEDATRVLPKPLPINFTVENEDPPKRSFEQWKSPGTRLVLYVTDGSSAPSFSDYQNPKTMGMAEYVDAMAVHPADLGENVLYYDPVDTVIWLSGNADDLDASGAHRRAALEQFVKQGGSLVVCQPADRHKIEALAPLLPVETKDAAGNWQITLTEKAQLVDEKTAAKNAPDIDALPYLSQDMGRLRLRMAWHKINADGKHPIIIASAKPLANATVDVWQPPLAKTNRTPYIVRGPYGLGCVTWVAQDLGDLNLNGPDSSNWGHVWDHVIGWHNSLLTPEDIAASNNAEAEKQKRVNGDGDVDLSKWMLQGTDFAAKGAAYVFLAVLFFIGYWFAAGPGTYLFLSRKKRKDLNWFIFGAWAFVGTALTVLLVRLVLRGDAEARHLTVMRQVIGEPAYVYSRVGLYIPRDGDQAIALDDTSKDAISYVTPLQEHPQYVQDTDFPASQFYGIPVHDDPQPVNVKIPFRSTQKKVQFRWVGDMPTGIGGSAKLIARENESGVIAGTLANQTGNDLKYVYFAFHYLERGGIARDRVLYVPNWKSGKSLDLNAENSGAKLIIPAGVEGEKYADPRENPNQKNIKGFIDGLGGWGDYWTRWSGGAMGGGEDERAKTDFDSAVPKSFPILSLFDRIAPGQNVGDNIHRVDFLRRGGTICDMSSSVAAGRLVILAQSDTDDKPIPVPLTVEGSRVGGQGRILYQFALPVDQSEMLKDAAKGE